MDKRPVKLIAACELIITVIMYFAIAYHFDNDRIIMKIMTRTDFEATILRLTIYIIPGINIICGIFGTVFFTDGLLAFTGLLEIFAGWLTHYFKGGSELLNIMGMIMIAAGSLVVLLSVISMIINTVKKQNRNQKQ